MPSRDTGGMIPKSGNRFSDKIMPNSSLVSVIIPACEAQARLPDAIASLIDQSWRDWEAIVVADDSFDYRALLAGIGLKDPRIRHAVTGGHRTGCHRARNAGYALAQGDFIADLDSDDVFYPGRLETLVPLARKHGAASDNSAVVSEDSGQILYHLFNNLMQNMNVDAAAFFTRTCPIFPVVRRDAHRPRLDGIEYAEDVVANLQLIGRVGAIVVTPRPLMEYRVVSGSMSHDGDSAERFDKTYADILYRIARNELDLPASLREVARTGFERKRALNRELAEAQRTNPKLDFQTFVAGRQR
jgi:succinoglycan biosynthesis protein ExoO